MGLCVCAYVCVYVGECDCVSMGPRVPEHTSEDNLRLPLLRQVSLLFAPVYARLADPLAPWYPPSSASHLSVLVLELQICTYPAGFSGFWGLNLGPQNCSASALSTKPQ